eukprot:m.25990 g.25990  ORF g.25990 m.25990 type:complete len:63 (-) comp8780_c0_seq4:3838-4026(-)
MGKTSKHKRKQGKQTQATEQKPRGELSGSTMKFLVQQKQIQTTISSRKRVGRGKNEGQVAGR